MQTPTNKTEILIWSILTLSIDFFIIIIIILFSSRRSHFELVSLLNGISTFMVYLMPNPSLQKKQ